MIAIVVIASLNALGVKIDSKFGFISNSAENSWKLDGEIQVDESTYWNVQGVLRVDGGPDQYFDWIQAHTEYGITGLSFWYSGETFDQHATEGFEWNDGYFYVPEDINMPEYGLVFSKGWYFGNGDNLPTSQPVDPPTLTILGGDTTEDFYRWLESASK